MADLQVLFDTIRPTYEKPEDTDFPINKIRFYMEFLYNGITNQALTEDQRVGLKQFIDLLNFMDDHKLEPTREIVTALNPQVAPMLDAYPSLAHTCMVVITSTIPAYQKYLLQLEDHVKNARPFTPSDVLLYYDMTLLDHVFLSHFFERVETANIMEVMITIKSVIVLNALVHDYMQDALGKSISMFTFIQRGGVPKDNILDFMQQIVNLMNDELTKAVQNPELLGLYRFLETKLLTMALAASQQAASAQAQQPETTITQGQPNMPVQPVQPMPIQDVVMPESSTSSISQQPTPVLQGQASETVFQSPQVAGQSATIQDDPSING